MNNHTNKNIVFLSGSLRSGTTVLGLMCAHHKNIYAPGEFDFFFDYITEHGSADKKEFIEKLEKDRVFQESGLVINKHLMPDEIIKDFIRQLSMNNEDQYLLLNIHRNYEKIPRLFPNAKYIHLLRDPRDVAKSAVGMGWCGNVYYGVDYWLQSEYSWDILIQKLNKENFIEIKFEELIEEPLHELSRICHFLRLDIDENMLNYPQNSTYSLPDKNLVNQWKRKQQKYEIQLIEGRLGKYLENKGYTLSGYKFHKPTKIEKLRLSIQNKLYQYKFGLNRYGASLFLGEKLTRHLKLKKLNLKICNKINKIDLKYLK
ncbi:MAG TPA: sulfotransferase [Saprospiraceae bacterium]|nr:sulfotransferase [Saprospiraceae bacterium]